MITHISDRESDIYEFLYGIPDEKNHVIVRATKDRNIDNSQKKPFEYVGEQEIKGSFCVKVIGSRWIYRRCETGWHKCCMSTGSNLLTTSTYKENARRKDHK